MYIVDCFPLTQYQCSWCCADGVWICGDLWHRTCKEPSVHFPFRIKSCSFLVAWMYCQYILLVFVSYLF